MTHWPAYILAGGQSRRFGADKARAVLEGKPLLRRLVDQLETHVGDVTVVADRAEKYGDLGLRTIADVTPGLGPVGGLATALTDMEARGEQGWCWLLACDVAELPAHWLEELAAHAPSDGRVVAYRDKRWQPMPGLYHPSIRPHVIAYLEQGGRAMWSLLEQLHACAVTPPDDIARMQMNTPEDYERGAGDMKAAAWKITRLGPKTSRDREGAGLRRRRHPPQTAPSRSRLV